MSQEVEILQQLKQQHAQFCLQRDKAQINFQQLIGAIFACETMIKQYEESLKKYVEKLAQDVISTNENQGEINGEIDSETAKQVA